MGHRLYRLAAMGALLLAAPPVHAMQQSHSDAPHCIAQKPFREVAEDETRRMADICPLPREVAEEEPATPGASDALRSLAFAPDRGSPSRP